MANRKIRPLAITAFFILIAILIYNKQGNQILNNTPVKTETPAISKTFPVDVNNKDIQDVFIAYNFLGNIKSLEKMEGDAYKLILTAQDPTTPEFIIHEKEIMVHVTDRSGQKSASFSDLKVGTRIVVSSTFDLKREIWITRAIYIPTPDPSQSQTGI